MKSRLTRIAALAVGITVGFGAGIAQADPHVVVFGGSSAAVGRTALWSVGTPVLRAAAAETRTVLRGDLRAAVGDFRAARQELRNGIIFFGQP